MIRADRFAGRHMFWDLQVSLVGEERAAAESLAEQAIALAAASGASGAPFNAEIRGNSSVWDATAVAKVAGLAERVKVELETTVNFEPLFTCARLWVSSPGGEGMKWHLDRTSPTQTGPGRLVRVLVALTATTEDNCTEFLDLGAAQAAVVDEAWARHNRSAVEGRYSLEHDVPYEQWSAMAPEAVAVPLVMAQWSVCAIDGSRRGPELNPSCSKHMQDTHLRLTGAPALHQATSIVVETTAATTSGQ